MARTSLSGAGSFAADRMEQTLAELESCKLFGLLVGFEALDQQMEADFHSLKSDPAFYLSQPLGLDDFADKKPLSLAPKWRQVSFDSSSR